MTIVSWLLLFLHYLVLTSTLGKEGEPANTKEEASTLTDEATSTLAEGRASTPERDSTPREIPTITSEEARGYNREG